MRISVFWGALCFCASVSFSATMLFDFEGEEGLKSIQNCYHYDLQLSQENGISSTGKSSLKISTSKWIEGKNRWPALNLIPSIHDWSPYDRIAITLLNPAPIQFYFGLFIVSEEKRIQQGLNYSFQVPFSGQKQYIIPLKYPKGIDPEKIDKVHFYFSDPEQDITLYVDSIALLKKGERPPEQPAAIPFVSSFIRPTVQKSSDKLDQFKTKILTQALSDSEKNLIIHLTDSIKKEIHNNALDFEQNKSLARYQKFTQNLRQIKFHILWFQSFHHFLKHCTDNKITTDRLILFGQAHSTCHVLPHGAFNVAPVTTFKIDLARNEKEASQLILLLNRSSPIENIMLSTSDLKGPRNTKLLAKQIDCDLMGYVKTKSVPPYARKVTPQWWPDPILDFIPSFDLACETTQSCWIRVRAPKNQPAGLYKGTLTLQAKGIAPQHLPFEVRIRDFTLPDRSPLPLAITFAPQDYPIAETKAIQDQWKKEQQYPINLWKQKKFEWADFLADYWISYDSLYHRGSIDFDILQHLYKQGRLGMFNLRYWHYFKNSEQARTSWKNSVLKTIQKNYLHAKELGILDHAYIYGCDEIKKEFFPQIREATDLIREACPGVPIMTTAYDKSYGLNSPLETIDAFCPLTPSYDPKQAQLAREAGKQVWWYICCSPHHPYANIFIEHPPIEARLLMGAMTAKMRPDGFLYYQISIWNSHRPITNGPFTDWNPRSWTTYHGDGSWTCVGPDGKPVPTQRLENFRDGLEDYAYVLELERRYTLAPQEAVVWRAKARAAINVPNDLVTNLKTYSHDESQLIAWRKNLADLIESAPVE